jgi:hypothetical protein
MKDFTNEELKQIFNEAVDDLGKRWLEFPWENKEAYSLWLAHGTEHKSWTRTRAGCSLALRRI